MLKMKEEEKISNLNNKKNDSQQYNDILLLDDQDFFENDTFSNSPSKF